MLIRAINLIVEWDQGRMFVLNPGEAGDLSDSLALGQIEAGNAVEAEHTAPEADTGGAAGDEREINPFTAEHKGFGVFHISGPGLAEPEEVKTKVAAEARLAELWDAHKAAGGAGGDGDAPVA